MFRGEPAGTGGGRWASSVGVGVRERWASRKKQKKRSGVRRKKYGDAPRFLVRTSLEVDGHDEALSVQWFPTVSTPPKTNAPCRKARLEAALPFKLKYLLVETIKQ